MKFRNLVLLVVGLATLMGTAFSQNVSQFVGDYSGVLGPYHVKLHLTSGAKGLQGTVDNPAQGLVGLAIADVQVNGQGLNFTIPAVHGAWTGFMSADGKSMSGMYNQGQTFSLTWTRGNADTAASPAVGAGAVAPPVPAQVSASSSTCPATSMGNYWDGSSWKPLTQPVGLPRERGLSFKDQLKNPLNPLAGYTNIKRYKGEAAAITLGPQPKFCFPVTVNSAGEVIIGALDVKKNERDIEMKASDAHHAEAGIPARKVVDVNVTRTSPTSVEAVPKEPLHPGQYVVNNGYMSFDFGVQ